jgi:hypothetical protein
MRGSSRSGRSIVLAMPTTISPERDRAGLVRSHRSHSTVELHAARGDDAHADRYISIGEKSRVVCAFACPWETVCARARRLSVHHLCAVRRRAADQSKRLYRTDCFGVTR